ncbi:MAG: DUF502 domain-containing protein [Proteobacteria bacterium]|nr:DUF502 domain-containing protein [Pseudomonadota bacterium]
MARKPKKKPLVKPRSHIIASMRNNFLTGLAVVLPVAVTIWAVWSFVGFVDARVLPFLPAKYNPLTYFDMNVRGMGVVVFIIFTTIIGSLTKGLFGRSLVRAAEGFVDRMPVVRSLYNGLKQIIETVVSQSSSSFEKACLVEYPRKGIWAVAFISTDSSGELLTKTGQKAMTSVFLPTTPNPTSGFLLFVPTKDIIHLDMSVEEAAKLVISAGLVMPPSKAEKSNGKAKSVRIAKTKAAK